ncbi:adenylate/guanylate cyclase domain-containing protein [Novispirillum sp. DQ9]|uniref:adenylate/guanylate cyclase domain-containing protein n=1 Tax=Novispirillum sp. DQ9 TaxID=3398612 RepID=UPI003C7A3B3E
MPHDPLDARPYPLRSRFRRVIVPVLVLLLAASVTLSLIGGKGLVESVYLGVAQLRAEALARGAERLAPEAWRRLASLSAADGLPHSGEMSALREAIATALSEARVEKLKIYDDGGRLIFSTDGVGLGTIDRGPALAELLAEREPQIVFKDAPSGALYELYVWLPDDRGDIDLVFELYEPVDHLDALLWANLAPQMAVPAALVLALGLLLWRMVERAQGDIDRRTLALAGMRDRLARLVSAQAVGAAQRASSDGRLQSTVMDATLYYADIRDFTSFAEENPPEAVISFLNLVLAVQIRAVRDHGGDIDKMIGDAVLAVFLGPDRAARAVACARAVLDTLAAHPDLPRGVGIGLHDGHVISGVIGSEERQDFTVIGDAVNVAARLCGLAAVGEIVTDTRTLARAGHPDGFAAPEDVQVKGRAEPLRIRRACAPLAA